MFPFKVTLIGTGENFGVEALYEQDKLNLEWVTITSKFDKTEKLKISKKDLLIIAECIKAHDAIMKENTNAS